jgi:hypothetical protein
MPELLRPGALILCFAALAGCKSEQQEHDEFVAACVAHKFEPAQCEFLAAMNAKASDDASLSLSLSAASVGLSAANAGKR